MRYSYILFAVVLSAVLAEKYAIIFQGDRYYSNYSDSSNTCRAYEDLIASGIPPEHIIYMLNEETLVDPQNPWPGQLFTLPDPDGEGRDHAAVCKEHIDYTSSMIDPRVVLSILKQDVEAVKEYTGLENPKVFETTAEDTLFIYYSDHGYQGGVSCGDSVITAKQLRDVLTYLYENQRYDKLVFYLEACESGSMFDTLPSDMNIYAFTSANSTELAWCEHCPPYDEVNHKHIGTCMSMYYDNAYQLLWEEESTTITLGEVFQRTHDEVAHYTHQEVSQYGDLTIGNLSLTYFIGDQPMIVNRTPKSRSTENLRIEMSERELHEAKWRAIRSPAGANDAAMRDLQKVVYENARQEIEVMRLGVALLGEKKTWEATKADTYEYDRECVETMFTDLVLQCHQKLPFPRTTRNIVHAICNQKNVPDVNWSSICIFSFC